jgi:DNA repair protein RadC
VEKLKKAGEALVIKVPDNIIIADGGYISMPEKGYMVGK